MVRTVSKPVVEFVNWMPSQKQICQNGKKSFTPMPILSLLIDKCLFSGGGGGGGVTSALLIKRSFKTSLSKKFQRPIFLQLHIKRLIASKMILLQHLAELLEALVILLQKTHCTITGRVVIANFKKAGSTVLPRLCISA